MIRLFNVYYPIRTLILLVGEALIVLDLVPARGSGRTSGRHVTWC